MRRLLALLLLAAGAFPLAAQDGAPLAPSDQRRLADGLFSRRLHALALPEYEKLLAQSPLPSEADLIAYRAGESARLAGQPLSAHRHYQLAIRYGNTSESAQRARLRLADLLLRDDKPAEALPFAEALLANPAPPELDAPARYTLGQILQRLQRTPEAATTFRALLQAHPTDAFAAYAALALAPLERNNPAAQRALYTSALLHPPSPDIEVEALWGLASLDAAAGDREAAADRYQALWKQHPDSARVRGGALHIAWALLQAGRHAEALALSTETTEPRKRDYADTWLYLDALCLRELGRSDDARAAYARLLREFPDSRFRPNAAYDLAVLHSRAGDADNVLPLAEDLLNVPGRRGEGLWLLAENARAAGRVPLALSYYTEIARLPDPHPRQADARHLRALLLQDSTPQAALEAWRDFIRLHPQDPRAPAALRSAGSLLLEAGNLPAALELWDRALRDFPGDPQSPDLLFQAALVELRLQQNAPAITRLLRYATLDPAPPRLPEAAFWLGTLLDQAGRPEEAEPWLRRALAADLPPAPAARARLRLGTLLQRAQRSPEALEVFTPLLPLIGENELPDALLLWMLQQASTLGNPDLAAQTAAAMVHPHRAAPTREMGSYALARHALAQNRLPDALRAYRDGLALQSGTLDAAEAGLELGSLLLSSGSPREALPVLQEAHHLASRLEQLRLQARALHHLGLAHAALENWNEAARHHMSVGVLFDDPELTPASLLAAAAAFEKAGKSGEAEQARRELSLRFPPPTPTPSGPPPPLP